AHVRVDVELPLEAVDNDLQVELAHAGDEGLAGLLVAADTEGRILLRKALQAGAELVLVGLRLRFHGDGDHRVGEGHRLELDRGRVRGERVTRGGVLEADGRGDLTGADRVALFPVICVHLQDATDALGPTRRRVHNAVAGTDLTRVDPEVGQL